MLSILVLLPLVGAALVGFLPGITPKASRGVALTVSVISFLWTLVLASQFNLSEVNQQFSEFIPWVDTLGLIYRIGSDGLSLPLLILNALLTGIAVYSSGTSISRPR